MRPGSEPAFSDGYRPSRGGGKEKLHASGRDGIVAGREQSFLNSWGFSVRYVFVCM